MCDIIISVLIMRVTHFLMVIVLSHICFLVAVFVWIMLVSAADQSKS